MTRHEIQVLRGAGISERRVAEQTGVSLRSVERISQQPPITSRIRTTRVGRPAQTAGWADHVAGWLAEDRHVPGMEILRRAHEAGYAGGKSALFELIDPAPAAGAGGPRGALRRRTRRVQPARLRASGRPLHRRPHRARALLREPPQVESGRGRAARPQ
jgi:hypothetical protein